MGMNGPYDSILGDDIEEVITRFKTGVFEKLSVAKCDYYKINGVILDFGINNKITRLNLKIKV